jgi:hypothetical protein
MSAARRWAHRSGRQINGDRPDMPWLPLSTFESQAVGVAVCGLGARGGVSHPISVRSSVPEGAMGIQVCGVLHLTIIARRCSYVVCPPWVC